PVQSADGAEIGTVREVLENDREHIFDGIVIDTPGGRRFVDAPEVARITDRVVTLTIPAGEVADLPEPGGGLSERLRMRPSVRRAQRMGREARRRWDQR
ncbi:MAG: hypothetical protein QOG11_1845, partial [Solirubrobacteraceae bacterium]|nr:hypothetical protein [Solirubrobacteraceae bacterium]